MRRALIGMILAATVLSPVAAGAQNWERGERTRASNVEHRGQARIERRQADSTSGSETRPQRQERQQARQQARSERRAERAARAPAQVQTQAPAQVSQPAAVAQSRRGGRGGDRVTRPGSAYPQAWQGNASDRTRRHYEQLERRNQWRYGTEAQRDEIRQERRDRRDRDGDGRGGWNGGDRDGRGGWSGRDRDGDRRDWRGDRHGSRNWSRDWNRGWRSDNRYNWSDWRHRYRNRYRLGHYYSPYRNWGYSRFSIGVFLQPLFYGQNYWIGDPYYYRLPPAPPGTQWVRYYNDVLLVDIYNGQVIDVIYDFFW